MWLAEFGNSAMGVLIGFGVLFFLILWGIAKILKAEKND